jgi:HEAT repeat protein
MSPAEESPLVKQLRSPIWQDRVKAVLTVHQTFVPGSAPADIERALIAATKDEVPGVRGFAAAVYALLFPDEPKARARLLQQLQTATEAEELTPMLAGLMDQGDRGVFAVDPCVRCLRHPSPEVRSSAISALQVMQEQGNADLRPWENDLLDRLSDDFWRVRENAARILGVIRPPSFQIVVALARLGYDENRAVRAEAFGSLESLGQAARPAIPHLLDLTRKIPPGDRFRVFGAIAGIGLRDKKDLEILIAALANVDLGSIGAALPAIVAFGPEAQTYVPALLAAFETAAKTDPMEPAIGESVRRKVREAISRMAPSS